MWTRGNGYPWSTRHLGLVAVAGALACVAHPDLRLRRDPEGRLRPSLAWLLHCNHLLS